MSLRRTAFLATAILAVLGFGAQAGATQPGKNGQLLIHTRSDGDPDQLQLATAGGRVVPFKPALEVRWGDMTPRIGPDGRRVFYWGEFGGKFKDRRIGGKGSRWFKKQPPVDSYFSFSPNGKTVIGTETGWNCEGFNYGCNPTPRDEYGLFATNTSSGKTRKLPLSQEFPVEAEFSPNGRKIAYTADETFMTEYGPRLYLANADGSGSRFLTRFSGGIENLSFSPDGRRVAYQYLESGKYGIAVTNLESKKTRILRSIDFDDGTVLSPVFSPDGKWIAYSKLLNGAAGYEVRLMKPNGAGDHRILKKLQSGIVLDWAPAAKKPRG